jgi:hypothetical protein
MSLAATPKSAQTSPINQQDPLQTHRQLRQVPHPLLLQCRVLHDVRCFKVGSAKIKTVCLYKAELDNKPTEKGKKFDCQMEHRNILSIQSTLLRLKGYMFRL